MAHVSEIIVRRTLSYSEEDWRRTPFDNLLQAQTLTPEFVHIDSVLHRFFDAFSLIEYMRAHANLASYDAVDFLIIDAAMVDQLQRILEVARSGRPELSQLFADEIEEPRLLNAIGALLTEDARGNLSQLNFVLNQIVGHLDQAEFTVFYRAEGN